MWLPGAALGGLLYGFSPYMVGQGADHLVFTFVPIPPFIALTIVSILQRKGSPWRSASSSGCSSSPSTSSRKRCWWTWPSSLSRLSCVSPFVIRKNPGDRSCDGQAVFVALPVIAVLLAYPVGCWSLAAASNGRSVSLENPSTRSAQLLRSRTTPACVIWNAIARGPPDGGTQPG